MTILFAAMAVATGRDALGVALVAAAVVTGQLSIGWLNDLCDVERDRQTGRADKPLAAGAISTRAVRVSAVTAALACIPLSLASGILAGSLHLIAVAAGWAYDLGLKASRASVLTFVVNMSLSPLFVVYGLPGSPHPPWWLPAVTTLLGCGAHFGNVLRDLDDDLATGVRGLPQQLGTATSRVLSVTLTLAAVVLLAVTAPLRPAVAVGAPLVAVLILAAGFLTNAGPRSQRPFQAVSVVGLITVGLLISLGPYLH
jgi:4-hydroxybenzoate polyprenyltransferase